MAQATKTKQKAQTEPKPSRKAGTMPEYKTAYHGNSEPTMSEKFFRKLYQKLFQHKVPENTLDTIPFESMYPDGTCKVTKTYYSKMIQFFDINYQLARNDEKQHIFGEYCEFLNYFDESVHFQFCFINSKIDMRELEKTIDIQPQDDDFNEVRGEYTQMLRDQLAKGNNGILKSKYIVFGIEASDKKKAIARLSKIETDVLNKFKMLGCKAFPLTGIERLKVMHDYMNQDSLEKFAMKSFEDVRKSGLTPKAYIAPTSFDFRNTKEFKIGGMWGTSNYLSIDAPEISDEMLADILNMEDAMCISIHLNSMNQAEAMKYIKGKLSEINKMKIDEQKKAIRSGYDIDILPPDIETYSEEAHNLLQEMQSRNERLFSISFQITSYNEKYQKMKDFRFQLSNQIQSANCSLKALDHQQEQGFQSSLPLGKNFIEIERNTITSAVAGFIPFTTQELFMDSPEACYMGLNALSNGLIMLDRKELNNPNGLFLGKPGSGKSFAVKREIMNCFLVTQDDIIICDPEAEYYPLVEYFQGQIIKLGQSAQVYINPLDINLELSDDETDPIADKADFIFSMFELIIGRKEGIKPDERAAIDMATKEVYQEYMLDPVPEKMPILQDYYEYFLKKKDSPVDQYLGKCLYMYVEGTNNVFNHRTTIDINNRIVCFDIKDLGKALKKLGMLIVQETVWGRVKVNRIRKKHTRYYIDEFHLLLRDEQTAAYSVEIWKRFRKWGGIPTGITQNVKDFLRSPEIENIFDCSDFIYMLNQGSGDAEILADKFNISSHLMKYITNVGQGEGLIFFGDAIQPFVDRFPKNTFMYSLLTSKMEETKQGTSQKHKEVS